MARVLIVEDEFLIAEMLAQFLGDLGHSVVGPASNNRDALALIEADAPTFAILDLTLGREQSIVVAEALRQKNIRFAFATGYGSGSLPEEFRDRPILTKPYDLDGVERLVAGI